MSGQSEAKRVGICLLDDEMFWWRCDESESCPVCSPDDEGYEANHRFFVAEAENQRLREALELIAEPRTAETAVLRELAREALAGDAE